MKKTQTSEKLPNIIFLMTDQQRFDALGCANRLVKTPNLDSLAARGIRFSQAVCQAPMCVPSRYSMMLGLYPSQSGLRHNCQICPSDDELPLPVLPQRLQKLGYQTAGFGKTHWYAEIGLGKDELKPSTRGFEVRAHRESSESVHYEPGMVCMDRDKPQAFVKLQAETAEYGNGEENELGYIGCRMYCRRKSMRKAG